MSSPIKDQKPQMPHLLSRPPPSQKPPNVAPQTTKLEIIFAWAFQIFAILTGALFGVYSILSYYAAASALSLSSTANDLANQLALYSLCQALLQQSSTGNTTTAADGASGTTSLVCSELLQIADMSQLVAQAFPGLVLPTPVATAPAAASPTSSPEPASSSPATGSASLASWQIGAIVGSLVGVVALVVATLSFFRLRQKLYARAVG